MPMKGVYSNKEVATRRMPITVLTQFYSHWQAGSCSAIRRPCTVIYLAHYLSHDRQEWQVIDCRGGTGDSGTKGGQRKDEFRVRTCSIRFGKLCATTPRDWIFAPSVSRRGVALIDQADQASYLLSLVSAAFNVKQPVWSQIKPHSMQYY